MIFETGCKSAVDGKVWDFEDARSNRVTPIASFLTGTLDYIKSNTYNIQVFKHNNVSDSKVQKGC